jgi:hypothetical protein
MDVTHITATAKHLLHLAAHHTRETSSPITHALQHAETTMAGQVPERELRIAARMASAATTTAGAYTVQALRDPVVRAQAIDRAIQLIEAGECSDEREPNQCHDYQTMTYERSPICSPKSRMRQTCPTGAWPSARTLIMAMGRVIRPNRSRARRVS